MKTTNANVMECTKQRLQAQHQLQYVIAQACLSYQFARLSNDHAKQVIYNFWLNQHKETAKMLLRGLAILKDYRPQLP